jgi:hypothetical protein
LKNIKAPRTEALSIRHLKGDRMIRAILAASVLAFSVGAMAEGTAPAAPAAAPATAPAATTAAPATTSAAPAPAAKMAGMSKEDCMKAGHKKGKDLKKCMSGKM